MFNQTPFKDDIRQAAYIQAEAQGLPTKKNEAWHYTDLPRLLRDTKPTPPLPPLNFADTSCITFRDGVCENSLPEKKKESEGVFSFAPYAPQSTNKSEALLDAYNLALAQDGLSLRVHKSPTQPLEVKTLGDNSHLRHHIIIEAGIHLTLIKTYGASATHNMCWDITLAQGASLNIIAIHYGDSALDTQTITLKKDATLHSTDFILNGGLVRHENHIHLAESGAAAHLHNAILGRDNHHHDMRCVAYHHAPHTTSTINSHNVLDDKARGIFQGKVIVERNAQHIDSNQNIRAIMLSDEAEMDSKPELEIYADDIVCAHGTSIGALDDDALFFLQARGIDKHTARQLLITAFIEQVAETIAPPHRALVQDYIGTFIGERAYV